MNQIERKFLDIQNSLHDIEYKFNDFNHLNSAIDQQAYKNLNDLTFSINRRNRILKEQLSRKIILSRLRPERWYQASFVDNADSDVEVVDVGPTVKFSDQNEVNKSPKKKQKILIVRPKNRQKATDTDPKKSHQKQKTASNTTTNKIQTIRRPPTADLIRPSTGDILLTNSRKVIVHKHPNFSDGNFITQEIVHSVHRRLKSKERKKREKTSEQNRSQKTSHEKCQLLPKSTQVSERRKKSVKKCIRESNNLDDDHAAKSQEKIVKDQHNDVISKLKNKGGQPTNNANEGVKKSGPQQLDKTSADKKIAPPVFPERNFSSPTFSSNQKIVEKSSSKPIQQRSRLPVRKNVNNDHLAKNRRSLTDTNIILQKQKGKKSRIPIQNGHVSSKINIFENCANNGESTLSVTSSSKTSTIPNKIPKNDQKVEKVKKLLEESVNYHKNKMKSPNAEARRSNSLNNRVALPPKVSPRSVEKRGVKPNSITVSEKIEISKGTTSSKKPERTQIRSKTVDVCVGSYQKNLDPKNSKYHNNYTSNRSLSNLSHLTNLTNITTNTNNSTYSLPTTTTADIFYCLDKIERCSESINTVLTNGAEEKTKTSRPTSRCTQLTNFSSLSKKTTNTVATLGNTTLVTGITDTQPTTKSEENTMNSKVEVATKNLSFNPKRAEMRDRLDEMFGKILNKV